jgi:CRISPR-associated protein Cas2
MWLFALFDLPVKTRGERKAAARFRIDLQQLGFAMLQWSVYARHFCTEEASDATKRTILRQLPDRGQVRLLSVTDRQFGKMDVYNGRTSAPPEKEPSLFEMF